jgi:hypothetical protein
MSGQSRLSALEGIILLDYITRLIRAGRLRIAIQVCGSASRVLAREVPLSRVRAGVVVRATPREQLLSLIVENFCVTSRRARAEGLPVHNRTNRGVVRALWKYKYPDKRAPDKQAVLRALQLLDMHLGEIRDLVRRRLILRAIYHADSSRKK